MEDNLIPSNISFDAYDNDVYQIILKFNGFLALSIGGFGIYITLYWTPKVFENYKYFLFNISLWAFLFDIYTTFFYAPLILYPAFVNCPMGILKTKNKVLARIWLDLFMFFFGGVTVAVLSAFIYRYAILKGKLKAILSARFLVFLMILHLGYEVPAITLSHLLAMNTTAVEESIIKVSYLYK